MAASSHFLHDVYSSFLAPLLPALQEKLAISYGEAGLLNLVRQLPVLANPFVGASADRRGLRLLLVAGPVLTVVSMSLLGSAPSVPVLALLLVGAGLGAALFHVPAPVLVRRLAGNLVGRGMAFYMVGGETARAVGPLVVAAAVTLWGLEGTWRLLPIGLLGILLLAGPLAARAAPEPPARCLSKSKASFRALRPHIRLLVALSAYTFLRAILKSSLTLYLPTLLAGRGEPLWYSNSCLSLLEAAGILGTFLGGTISDRIGRIPVLVAAALLGPALALLFLSSAGPWSLFLLAGLGLVAFAPGPVLLAVIQDAPCEQPALLNGLYMSLAFGGSALAAAFVGTAADLVGLHAALVGAALVSTLATIAVATLPRNDGGTHGAPPSGD